MDKKEALKLCICRKCPSYVKCGENVAFCYNGKSKCIKKENGCLCPACPVQAKAGFSSVFYCIRGKAKK